MWVGDPRGGYAHPMKYVVINGTYYAQVFGGTLPGPIWKAAMEGALAGTEPRSFALKTKWGLTASHRDRVRAAAPGRSSHDARRTEDNGRRQPQEAGRRSHFDNSDPATGGGGQRAGEAAGPTAARVG